MKKPVPIQVKSLVATTPVMRAVQWLSWAFLIIMAVRTPGDPDMGWHLQNGNYILQHLHLPPGDIYSWTMPGYPWVPHEWASDVMMAAIYHFSGLTGLVIFFTIIIGLLLWVTSRIYRTNWFIQIMVAATTLFIAWSVIGARPQMFTLLGTALVLWILFRWREQPNSKLIWWLLPIFWIWANLHGGFLTGGIVAAIFVVGECLRHLLLGRHRPSKDLVPLLSWQAIRQLIIIGGISFIATFLTPNLWRSYQELYQTLSDTKILSQIAEWLRVTLSQPSSYNAGILGLWLVGLMWFNKWKFDTTKLILALVVLGFALTAWRHLPLFAIAAAPLLAEQLTLLLSGWKMTEWPWAWCALLLLIVTGFDANRQYLSVVPTLNDFDRYAAQLDLPRQAALLYLKQHPPSRMFNEYNWGGYLIWQLPEVKVFIDGRMAIWETNNLKIFDDFQSILSLDSREASFYLDKWQVNTIFIRANRPLDLYLQNDSQWRLDYHDELSAIWTRV